MFYHYLEILRKLDRINIRISPYVVKSYLKRHNAIFDRNTLVVSGVPKLRIEKGGGVRIGKRLKLISSPYLAIDNSSYSKIQVQPNARLTIGDNVGITNSVIFCNESITIGNYVNIGAGCMIVDSDFHSLDWKVRMDRSLDIQRKKNKPVIIKDHAFIGAHSIILKGSIIGEKSIVGAGSVVACNIPDGEVWAGNPARFIKKID